MAYSKGRKEVQYSKKAVVYGWSTGWVSSSDPKAGEDFRKEEVGTAVLATGA